MCTPAIFGDKRFPLNIPSESFLECLIVVSAAPSSHISWIPGVMGDRGVVLVLFCFEAAMHCNSILFLLFNILIKVAFRHI